MPKRTALPAGIRQRGASFQVDASYRGIRKTGTAPTLPDAILLKAQLVERIKGEAAGKIAEEAPEVASVCSDVGTVTSANEGSWTLRKAVDKALTLPRPEGWAGSKSLKTFRINGEAAVSYFGATRKLDAITVDDIDNWVAHLMAQGNANGTINRKKSALSMVFKIAKRRGGCRGVPHMSGRLPEPVGRIRQVSPAEEKNLLDLLERTGKPHHRDAVVVLIETGMRCGELWALEDQDVDLKSGVVMIYGIDGRGTKNGTFRSVPMLPRTRAILKRRLEDESREDRRLFPYDNAWMRSTWDRVRGLMGLLNDPHFTPHVLRHTCCSRLAQKGVSVMVMQKWMGHKTLVMTQRYTHLYPTDLMAAAERLATSEVASLVEDR